MKCLNIFRCGSNPPLSDNEEDTEPSRNSVHRTNSASSRTSASSVRDTPDSANQVPKDITWIWYGAEPSDDALRNIIGIAASHPDFACRLITDNVPGVYKALDKIEGASLNHKRNNLEIVDKDALYAGPIGILTKQDLADLEIAASLERCGPLRNYAAASDIDRLLAVYRYGTRYLDVDVRLKAVDEKGGRGPDVDKQKLPEPYRNLVLTRKKLPESLVAKYGMLTDIYKVHIPVGGGHTASLECFGNTMLAAPPQSPIVGNALKKIARHYKQLSREDLEKLISNTFFPPSVPKATSTITALQARAGGNLFSGHFQNKVTGLLKRQTVDGIPRMRNTRESLTMALTGPTFLMSELKAVIRSAGKDPEKLDKTEISLDYDLQHHFVPDTSGLWANKITHQPSAEAEDILSGKNKPKLPYLTEKTRREGTALRQQSPFTERELNAKANNEEGGNGKAKIV